MKSESKELIELAAARKNREGAEIDREEREINPRIKLLSQLRALFLRQTQWVKTAASIIHI